MTVRRSSRTCLRCRGTGATYVSLLHNSRPATEVPGIFDTGLKRNTAAGGVLEITYILNDASYEMNGMYECAVGQGDQTYGYRFSVDII